MNDSRSKPLVVGIGNSSCGDDAVGPEVVARIRESHTETLTTQTIIGDPSQLIGAMKGHRFVILVDAMLRHSATGALHIFDASKVALPAELFATFSTHSFGLANAIELARALGELPQKLVVLGIEGERFDPGQSMSSRVQEAVADAARWIIERSDAYSIAGHD